MSRSAIVLAGGSARRMGSPKSLLEISGKPLIAYTIECIKNLVDEVVVVTGNRDQADKLSFLDVMIIFDAFPGISPLVGAYSGFREVTNGYSLLVGGDMPLINKDVVKLLFERAEDHNASTPYWPNGWIEPLHAVYRVSSATHISKELIDNDYRKLGEILRRLTDVERIPIEEIRLIDPELYTLKDIDTEEDFKRFKLLIEKSRN